MTLRNFKPHSCDIDENGPDSIHRAVGLAQLFGAINALPQHMLAKLAILVEEAVTNLYDHGDVAPGFCGSLTISGGSDGVHVTLTDSGAAFDPRSAGEIDMPNEDRGGGVGLAMIRAWADVLDYRRQGDRNVLELTMRG